MEAEQIATALTEADIFAMDEPEIGQETRTFNIKGKAKTLTIETNGREVGERWAELLQAQMYGQTQEAIAKAQKKPYREEYPNLGGKPILITNPSYSGALRMLHKVLVSPKMRFEALVVFGHRAGGAAMDEITKWAEDANGMSAFAMEKLAEISKNLSGGEDSRDESEPPV